MAANQTEEMEIEKSNSMKNEKVLREGENQGEENAFGFCRCLYRVRQPTHSGGRGRVAEPDDSGYPNVMPFFLLIKQRLIRIELIHQNLVHFTGFSNPSIRGSGLLNPIPTCP